MIMPENDGVEMLWEILQIDSEATVFTFSGKGGAAENNAAAVALGAKRGFGKPLKVEELLGAVKDTVASCSHEA